MGFCTLLNTLPVSESIYVPMTTPVANSASQPAKMIPPTQNKKNFQNPTRETCKLGIMAKLAFSCQKSIPATLSNVAERTLTGP